MSLLMTSLHPAIFQHMQAHSTWDVTVQRCVDSSHMIESRIFALMCAHFCQGMYHSYITSTKETAINTACTTHCQCQVQAVECYRCPSEDHTTCTNMCTTATTSRYLHCTIMTAQNRDFTTTSEIPSFLYTLIYYNVSLVSQSLYAMPTCLFNFYIGM